MADVSTQLDLYNSSLLICQERPLASLTDNNEPRRLLDIAWNDGAVDWCLEQGQWYFAMRADQISPDAGIAPTWGYKFAFDKPSDWVLTCALCVDENLRVPLTRYFDEAGFWYTDINLIYVRYVSNDPSYGNNMAIWPRAFYNFIAAYLASRIIGKLSTSKELREEVKAHLKETKLEAKNRGAMAAATAFPAQGAWTLSRQRFLNRRDGGNVSGTLIG